MALIRCYDCGKEISSLATACPSCGAPPRPAIVPPPLPTQASRAKQLSWGTIALLTGVVLVLVIRGVTHQPNSLSVATSPTPATAEATTASSPPGETASQRSPSVTTAETPAAEGATTSSPLVEATSQSSPSHTAAETPTAEATTTSSVPVDATSQSSQSPIATAPYASDASTATAPPPRATYHVIGIPLSDYLNVREGAGSDYPVVTRLEPGAGGILLGTQRVANGDTTWQEITVHGQTGWVNAAYIGLETQAPAPPMRSPTESSTAP